MIGYHQDEYIQCAKDNPKVLPGMIIVVYDADYRFLSYGKILSMRWNNWCVDYILTVDNGYEEFDVQSSMVERFSVSKELCKKFLRVM